VKGGLDVPVENRSTTSYLCFVIIFTLGVIAVVSIVGIIVADIFGHASNPALVSLSGTCIGILGAYLVAVTRADADKSNSGDNVPPSASK